MVLQGDALVSQKAKQVTVDLTSAERAGRSAEAASKSAEGTLRGLADQVSAVTEKMHLAVRVAERLASAAGVEGPALSAIATGASSFIAVNRLAAPLNAFLPGASLALGAAAGLYTGVASYEKSEADQERRSDEQAEKLAGKIADATRKQHDSDVASLLARQAAISLLESHGRGGSGALIP